MVQKSNKDSLFFILQLYCSFFWTQIGNTHIIRDLLDNMNAKSWSYRQYTYYQGLIRQYECQILVLQAIHILSRTDMSKLKEIGREQGKGNRQAKLREQAKVKGYAKR